MGFLGVVTHHWAWLCKLESLFSSHPMHIDIASATEQLLWKAEFGILHSFAKSLKWIILAKYCLWWGMRQEVKPQNVLSSFSSEETLQGWSLKFIPLSRLQVPKINLISFQTQQIWFSALETNLQGVGNGGVGPGSEINMPLCSLMSTSTHSSTSHR